MTRSTHSPLKSLDQKLQAIASDPSNRSFILADAKDPDMGLGIAAPGPRWPAQPGQSTWRSMPEFLENIRQIVRQGLVDLMLMSPSVNEKLAIDEQLFEGSAVTPAARANDTTDIWCGNSGSYTQQPSLAFRTSSIDHIQYGRILLHPCEASPATNLGLYSITFNNDAARDREALIEYRRFREEAEAKGFRHFLEVFAPNALEGRQLADVGRYVNDSIVRTLAGVTRAGRPVFLKIPYFGPAAMEELAAYDPSLVIGILGGSSGTTRDAFQMLHDARRHGARAALFGRKINHAEDQLAFIEQLRLLADGQIDPIDAVERYHDHLQKHRIPPKRSLEEDLQATSR